jgi:galactokinase
MGQWSEHNFVGVRCGIMDQFANMMGKENHVILLDCRSMVHTYLPINLSQHALVLFNSGVKHSLASSEYNIRRAECEEGVHVLLKMHPRIKSLRDASLPDLESVRTQIPAQVFNRCKYIIEEIERVRLASADLQRGDLTSFGRRMFETHAGLSKLYQVSCDELDFLVAQAQRRPEVLGARMMGGGFGGCTINLIKEDNVNNVIDFVTNNYRKQFGISTEVYTVRITGGTSTVGGV